jgi:hypothetical protein
MDDDVIEYVADGAALLDGVRFNEPGSAERWWHRIDLDTLDVWSWDKCVLGQVFGDYVDGLNALGLDFGFAHGFNSRAHDKDQFDALNQAWRTVVIQRREQEARTAS